jgi:RNA polymerase sigma-70 factor, ECF subfamily
MHASSEPTAAAAPSRVEAAAPGFAEVYRDHAPFVWRVLRRLGIAPAELEDACQEVFLVVHRKLAGFEQRSSLRTWLYGIAVRCAADHRRRIRRSTGTPAAPAVMTELAERDVAVDAEQPDAVAQAQARAMLDEILDELDHDKRAVFVLYELEELTMAEVASAVGCPLQTAYSRLHAARAAVEAAVKRRRAREDRP